MVLSVWDNFVMEVESSHDEAVGKAVDASARRRL